MLGLVILVSIFSAFAKRVAYDHVELQSQAATNKHGVIPTALTFKTPRLPATARPGVKVGPAPKVTSYGEGGLLPRLSVSPSMSMQDDEYSTNLPKDWKTERDNELRQTVRLPDFESEEPEDDSRELVAAGADAATDSWHQVVDTVINISEQVRAADDPAKKREALQRKRAQSEYTLNVVKAYDVLRRDVPEILIDDDDPNRSQPTDWSIYRDNLETDLTNIAKPNVLKWLSILAPSASASIKGLSLNQRATQELRNFCKRFVIENTVTDQTGITIEPFSSDLVVTSNWKTALKLKSVNVPKLLRPIVGVKSTPEAAVTISGASEFQFDEMGKIYRHSIDQLDIVLDESIVASPQIELLLKIITRGQPETVNIDMASTKLTQ